ncbi:ninein-like protein isoform X3 [Synchiropus splendidus]|uniref:ninein-like protein isoform X3 n=1 Tax=Synchiropus splendidus TaxID=270530 RepID=UPI00237DE444|nr:ninein-like protein isoform X3 [Synchiropus splendidus]
MEGHSCYVSQLKAEFDRCDSTSSGLLSKQELTVLCQNLQLDAHQHHLLETLLGEHVCAGVDFPKFKSVLVSVLSGSQDDGSSLDPVVPQREVKPKWVQGSKCYGRRSCPDHKLDSVQDSGQAADVPRAKVRRELSQQSRALEDASEDHCLQSRWGDVVPDFLSEGPEEAPCALDASGGGPSLWHSPLAGAHLWTHPLHASQQASPFCLQEVLSCAGPCCCSTPAPQRLTQPAAASAPPSLLMASVGAKVLSQLDDGSGFTAAERVIAVWTEEGLQRSQDVLQTLDFSLEELVSLADLTVALDNELLVSGNGIHQAALISYKSELQHLQVLVDQAVRQKEKMRLDLEAAESRILQLVREVDDRQASLETLNQSRLRELQQSFREKLSSQRLQAEQDNEALLQQLDAERRHLLEEVSRLKVQEGELQEELGSAIQEKSHLQEDLCAVKQELKDSQMLVSRLQSDMEQLLQHKFGSLDPGAAVLTHEERCSEMVREYELRCRELRDRNDELSSELDVMRSQRSFSCRTVAAECAAVTWAPPPDAEEPDMKQSCSPATQKKLEDKRVSSVSLQTELAVEQLQQKHQQEVKDLQAQLETQVNYYERSLELMRQSAEVERKDVAQAFKLEITELEEQKSQAEKRAAHLKEALDSLQAQLQHGGRSWSPEQERRLQRERADMEQNFAREISNLVQQLSSEKEHLEAELQLKMDQEVMLVRTQLGEVRSDNSALQERLTLLQQQLVSLEDDVATKTLEELQREREVQTREEELLLTENSAYREEVMSLSGRNLQLSSQNRDLSARLHEEQESALMLRERQAVLLQQLQDGGAQAQLKDGELRSQQEAWTQQRRHLEEELASCKSKLQQLCGVEAELLRAEEAVVSLTEQVSSPAVERPSPPDQEGAGVLQVRSLLEERLGAAARGLGHGALEREREEQAALVSAALSVAQQEELALLQTRLEEEQEKSSELQEELRRSRSQTALAQEQHKEVQQRVEELELQRKGAQLVLQEKVQQLQEQLLRNSQKCNQLRELYVENAQLMGALQLTEQRQKDSEKKNFLLEEKVHALNQLLKELVSSALAT